MSVIIDGMNGISTFTLTTITTDGSATVWTVTGWKVGLEFIAEALKHSRFVLQPTDQEK